MFRRIASYSFSGLILFSALFSVLLLAIPERASATDTVAQDTDRRLLIAFKRCLSNQKIDEDDGGGNPAENFLDMWDDDGKAYTKEDIVVGFDLERENGVKSCRTSIQPGLKLVGEAVSNIENAEAKLFELLKDSSKSGFQTKRDNLVARVDGALDSLGRNPRRAFTANRLAPLVTLCYDIQENALSTEEGSQDFRATLAGKQYFFKHKTDADDDDYAWIDQGNEGKFDKNWIGDIELGFTAGDDGGIGGSNWSSYSSDFYPFGSDLPNFTAGYTGNDGILDCEFIKKNISFFTDEVVLGVDTSEDSIQIGMDTNGDGKPEPDQQLDPLDSPASASGENKATCESEGLTLSWIICPLLYLGDAVLRKLDQALIGLLSIPNDYYTNPNLENAWSRLRNIAYFLLVPVILVMVISTALGFEFVSAYTVKRALPRFIVAVIFIALSFEITKFLVVLTNDIGRGIHGLIISAFVGSGGDVSLASIFSPNNSDSLLGLGFAGLGGVGILAVGSIGIVLSYILVGIVGLAIGFFLLSMRQMLIIALMILAPVAILSWIFPGNDKMWKLWWGTFSKLLLLFPLIMLLIAVGKSFATIVSDTDGSFVSTLIKLVAYVGPYFLIPATFKFAGGLFATVAGMANDRGRGFFDRNKKYRQGKVASNWASTQTGQRFKGTNRVTGRLNRMGMGAASGVAGGFGLGQRGRIAADEMTMTASDEHMKSQAWRGNMFKDNAMHALTYENETAARDGLQDRVNRGLMSADQMDEALVTAKRIGYGRTSQVAAARQLAMNKTGYANAADAMDTVRRVSGGNETMEGSLRENVQYISKGVGRHDLGKMRRARNGEDRTDWNRSMTLQGAQTADGVTLARDHSKSAENISAATRDVLEGGHAGDRDAAERIATGMGGSETYGTLGNQEEIQSVGTIRTNNRVPGRTIGQEGRIEADGTINLRDVHESVDETYGSRARGRTPDPRDPDVQPPDADGNPT